MTYKERLNAAAEVLAKEFVNGMTIPESPKWDELHQVIKDVWMSKFETAAAKCLELQAGAYSEGRLVDFSELHTLYSVTEIVAIIRKEQLTLGYVEQ